LHFVLLKIALVNVLLDEYMNGVDEIIVYDNDAKGQQYQQT